MRRRVVLGAVFIFIAGFGFLTLSAMAEQGVTLAGLLSVFILVLLGVGILGALLHPPK